MEKRIRRPAGLTALFWRYLITTGVVVILLAVLWWFGMTTMMRYGIVYPANTAASGVEAVAQALSSGELDTEEIPYFYRWAIFDGDGQVRDPGNMDEKHLAYAEAALAGERDPQGMFYSQYHRLTQLPDGTTCVLQYDYSMPYGAEVLQRRLPEFQTCVTVVLLLAWLTAGAISTHHFAGLLRRDAALLTGATEAIAQRRLDVPITGRARVREFGATLKAMDDLRRNLAESLESQWGMEQQRRLELAALTHDLKTPLSVISGNAELLGEDALTPGQRESVDAIFRSALRLQDCNLLDNAARYTLAGGTVTLSVTMDGEMLTIAVENTGPGFSPEALARGEQAFYTSDASRPQEGHMGMGLYFAGQTAKRHGGALRLANTGHGARAELVLPIN